MESGLGTYCLGCWGYSRTYDWEWAIWHCNSVKRHDVPKTRLRKRLGTGCKTERILKWIWRCSNLSLSQHGEEFSSTICFHCKCPKLLPPSRSRMWVCLNFPHRDSHFETRERSIQGARLDGTLESPKLLRLKTYELHFRYSTFQVRECRDKKTPAVCKKFPRCVQLKWNSEERLVMSHVLYAILLWKDKKRLIGPYWTV